MKNIEESVESLLGKMTLEEKIGQMHQLFWEEKPDIELYRKQVEKGSVGSFYSSDEGSLMSVKDRNELQKIAVEQSRLGIPLMFAVDVLHGYRTIFPIPLAQSCTWNPNLITKAASISAKEATSDNVNWTYSPMVDIARDPRWGRIAEGLGEDTYLASVFSEAMVRGYQGTDLTEPSKLAVCLKHYVTYGAAEGGRDKDIADISERTLREVYLPPFKAGIDAGAATLMSAFNEIGGIPATANRHTLTEILRDEWDFDGFVISDWNAILELVSHGIAKDTSDATQKAVIAGIDMDMKDGLFSQWLTQLVRDKEVPIEVIDESTRRILRIKFRAGLFDHPYVDPNLAKTTLMAEESLSLARKVAQESIVLLKNENALLPLKKEMKCLALIGPLADNKADLLGCWPAIGRSEDVITVLKGINDKILPECELLYAKGCDLEGSSTSGFAEALNIAKQADMVVMAVGESAIMSGETRCRSTLKLPGVQQQLVEAVHATGKPIVVVLFSGRPLSISWIKENVPAILFAWQPGTQGGNAVADCLFGDYNPSGKLTVSFPRTVGQIPVYYNHKNTGRPHELKYLNNMTREPLFAFGYGLSYTNFEYSNIWLSSAKITPDQSLIITSEIKNTGDQLGQEVVQLYIRDLVGSVTRPVKELRGLQKITLKPGEQKQVSFTLTHQHLSFYNQRMDYVVEPGLFKVWVGPSSTEGLEGQFEVVLVKNKSVICSPKTAPPSVKNN